MHRSSMEMVVAMEIIVEEGHGRERVNWLWTIECRERLVSVFELFQLNLAFLPGG
jgi:hypothetical protein